MAGMPKMQEHFSACYGHDSHHPWCSPFGPASLFAQAILPAQSTARDRPLADRKRAFSPASHRLDDLDFVAVVHAPRAMGATGHDGAVDLDRNPTVGVTGQPQQLGNGRCVFELHWFAVKDDLH
jgi:hypothetical protein